jgi:hypothetical protein
MATDFLEQLANVEVPPPPETLTRDVNERLNKVLLALHIADFGLHAMTYAAGHFLRGVFDLVIFTLSGQHVPERTDPPAPPVAPP